jgi:hypothetical protein
MEAVSRSILIFYVPMVIVLLLVTYIPALTLWLPSVVLQIVGVASVPVAVHWLHRATWAIVFSDQVKQTPQGAQTTGGNIPMKRRAVLAGLGATTVAIGAGFPTSCERRHRSRSTAPCSSTTTTPSPRRSSSSRS